MATILLIDDDASFRRIAQTCLNRAGHKTYAVGNGQEGVNSYPLVAPDLVITDLIMPEKEGLETIVALRQIDPNVRIMAISGGGRYNDIDYLGLAKRVGAQKVLGKPFEINEMLDAISELLAA